MESIEAIQWRKSRRIGGSCLYQRRKVGILIYQRTKERGFGFGCQVPYKAHGEHRSSGLDFSPSLENSYFEVSDAGNSIVLFEFELEVDVVKVLLGEPWSFDRHLVVLEQYDGSTPVQNLKFNTTSF